MNILLPLAEGFEDIEAISVIDVLRRANLNIVTVGLPGSLVTSSRGVQIRTDKKMDDINIDEFDVLVLVGGSPGYLNLGKSRKIMDAIVDYNEKKKLIGAICAAPSLLAKAGIMENRKATIYPGMEREIPRPRDGKVIVDENIITSQGPGTAIEFALNIVEKVNGSTEAARVRKSLVA